MVSELPGEVPVESSGPSAEFLIAIKEYGIELEAGEVELMSRYLDLLYIANEKMNLTGVRDRNTAWMRHIFDALTLLPILQQAQARSVVDVGSGGGLPGLVLAIVLPDSQITLIESTGKKANFLKETVDQLGLKNVRVLSQRAEVLGAGELRECNDVVVSRAVSRLPSLLEFCLPMVRQGGHFVAIKGVQVNFTCNNVLHALGVLRGVVIDQVRTPTGTLIVIEKTGLTPKRYPRATGEPERQPL
ncbi:MAG: 16S rRNA (guanine(527)-N(7))-methyltransferase RsmG [Planctomycetota bacterium]|nr:16S rRNA (guanine(527)-N(7))-methyltransferase RsmG [Planctomycetota bacterium]